MRVQLLVLISYLLAALSVMGQDRNSNWCFGDSAGIAFNGSSSTVFTSSVKSRGSCVSISDSVGQLQFYAYTRATVPGNSGLVINKEGSMMNNGNNIVGEGWYEEMCIIPDPGNPSQYYLFSVGVTGSSQYGLFYSIIDMSLDSGRGSVTQKNVQLQGYSASDCIGAVKHGNGRDWWIISRRWDYSSDEFYEYLISPTGIAGPYIQQSGTSTNNGVYYFTFDKTGGMFISIDARGLIELFNFDRCSGSIIVNQTVSSEATMNIPWYFGLAISPNSRYLYVSQTGITTPESYLFQFDLQAANIFNSIDTLWTFSSNINAAGSLRLAPDNKIYLASAWNDGINFNYPYPDSIYNSVNNNLSVINYPDSGGNSCDFVPFGFNLGIGRCYWGLPKNADYEMVAKAGSTCDSLSVGLFNSQLSSPELNVFYQRNWKIAFINAKDLKGKRYQMSIFDSTGKEVFTEAGVLSADYYSKDVAIPSLANGIYIIRFLTEKENLFQRFVNEQ
jgi:hypothetical protein